MAIRIDRSLLDELGLGSLPENEKAGLLNHIYETLEMRVGMRLADQMSNEQLDEFEKYFEAKDDAGAFKWLETNFPNYKEIVQEEFDKLRLEIQQSAPQLLQASQNQQAMVPPSSAPLGTSDQMPQAPQNPAYAPAQPFTQPQVGPQPYSEPPALQAPFSNPYTAPAAPSATQPASEPATDLNSSFQPATTPPPAAFNAPNPSDPMPPAYQNPPQSQPPSPSDASDNPNMPQPGPGPDNSPESNP